MRHALLLFLVLAAGCGRAAAPQVIDGTSEESFLRSVNEIRETLSADDRKLFEAGMETLATAPGLSLIPGAMNRAALDSLHGKSVDEILDAGKAQVAKLERLKKANANAAAKAKDGRREIEHLKDTKLRVELEKHGIKFSLLDFHMEGESEYTDNKSKIRMWGTTTDSEGNPRSYEALGPVEKRHLDWIKLDGETIYESPARRTE